MKKLIVIGGPTAVGKSEVAIRLAKRIGGQVISADSMQVYKHMDIGTAKLSKSEMEGVVHHLIDVLDPREDYDVYRFKGMAEEAMEKIYEEGDIPILAGGSGFYAQAVCFDTDFDEADPEYREYLYELKEKQGSEFLHDMLFQVDPDYAESIHHNNTKRVIRALEYFHTTGKKLSLHNEEERKRKSPYELLYFVLTDNRQSIYERINKRVDQMIEAGLVEEVRRLKEMGVSDKSTSAKGIGYRQIYEYLDGKCSLDSAIERIKTDTRHFAKRQLTWYKRERDIIWIDRSEYNGVEDIVEEMIGDMAFLSKSQK